MNIALIGYGKMGQVIEEIAVSRGHHIVGKYRSADPIPTNELSNADVAIEFSVPKAARENILKCFEAQVPVVVGTTGWYHDFEEIGNACQDLRGGLFHATNFSIGVNIFFELNRHLARLMNGRPEYTPVLHEIHHTQKLDAPSGTGITLAEGLIDEIDRLDGWTDIDKEESNQLLITHERLGDVPGTHQITWDSEIDHIFIEHAAKGRKGFALGAVLAAEWMKNRKGVYSMRDMLKI